MADGISFENLQKTQNKLDQLLQTEITKHEDLKIQEWISGTNQNLDHLTQTLVAIRFQLLKLGKKHVTSEASNQDIRSPSSKYAHNSFHKIDFPRFDGTNSRIWILKCINYFKLMPEICDVQKIRLAIMHFDGKALMLSQTLNLGESGITWEQFLEVVLTRFEDWKVRNIILEFNKLHQDGTYDEYVERFQELMACMVIHDESRPSEEYYITSFLSGLSEELGTFIQMFQPKTLHQAIELGKEQLIVLEAISRKWQQLNEDEEIIEALEAVEFGTPVETDLVQTVREVQDSIRSMVGKEGFVPKRAVGIVETHQLNTPFSPRLHKVEEYHLLLGRVWLKFFIRIKWDYLNMVLTTFLNAKKVKFKFLFTTVDKVVGPLPARFMLKEIIDFDDIFPEGTNAGHDKQFEVDMKFLKFQPWTQHSLYWSRGKKVVPVLISLADDVVGALVLGTHAGAEGINGVLHGFTDEGLVFSSAVSVASSCCKKNKFVQKWYAADDKINYNLQYLFVLQIEFEKTPQPQTTFQAIGHPQPDGKIEDHVTIYAVNFIEEYSYIFHANEKGGDKQFEVGAYKINLCISSIVHPTFHALLLQRCSGVELVPMVQFPEDAAARNYETVLLIFCKFSSLDPRGRGSSSGGGIVMTHEGGKMEKLKEEERCKLVSGRKKENEILRNGIELSVAENIKSKEEDESNEVEVGLKIKWAVLD